MIAIIPAAGKGTRMLPVTQGRPKELLPLGGKRMIQRVAEEAAQAEVDGVVIISSPEKPEIDSYTEKLVERELRGIPTIVRHQPVMRGLADAIAQAGVEDDVLVLLGDVTFHGGSPTSRMAELLRKGIDGAIAVEQTDDAGTKRYGIVDIHEFTGGILSIKEKPGPEATESRWAVAGRYALSIRLLGFLLEQVDAFDGEGEIGVTPILQRAIEAGFDLKAVALQSGSARIDCGSPEEYAAARLLPWD